MTRDESFPPRTGPGRRRALGQHFLRNAAAADQIVAAFAPAPGEVILEIGPGHGALTGRLLDAGAIVAAVEKDRRAAEGLISRLGGREGLHLTVADALKVDFEPLLRGLDGRAGARFRLLANLPYSVGTEIACRILMRPDLFSSMTVMLQREVAERICAEPGGRTYGSLSLLAQYFAEPRVVMRLAPGSFEPKPEVHSAVVLMPIRARRELDAEAEAAYPAFLRTLFHQRRRTLPHNLEAAWGPDRKAIAERLAALGIDPARRPETLTREECLRLFGATRP